MSKLTLSILTVLLGSCLVVIAVNAGENGQPLGWIDFDSIIIPSQAAEVTEINLDSSILGMINLDSDSTTRDIISLRLKTFEIDSTDFEKYKLELEQIDTQFSTGIWKRMVRVVKPGEFTSISFCMNDSHPAGMVILSVDHEEVTVINMVGVIDLANLDLLGLDDATLDSLQKTLDEEE
ncbi:MAG: DUF4252 domain-containing protein [Candidatus Delongbacteria bacterium]|nr:DUF4252 domain-containing protein [Candidatus Delongbacteria bacterium]